ncbi:hypothetical protein [Oceanicola sp. S124]|uniref:hypothetical protein n=1 Tax=Oceanicola sp. S124 TaxID=1042378 RepID=UPI00025588C7|nr:hypothetical protein [Oceanicola sp. S124]
MKMLVHRTPAATGAPFDLPAIKVHVRVDDGSEDAALTNIGHTAASEIEHFAQIALLRQTIVVTILGPDLDDTLYLPIGPALPDAEPSVSINGQAFTDFLYFPFTRPVIVWGASYLATIPQRVDIEYQAGFGDTAADIPPDLAQALMDQAALHFDGRSPMSAKELTTSPHMARIGARYRGVKA